MRKRLFNRDERGISTVIVAVSLLGLFGAAMLSLDAGNMWQTRRNIITVTDATALGQAKYLAFAPTQDNCEATWTDFMVNLDGAGAAVTPLNCTPTAAGNGTGYVVVDGRKEARTRFGGLFGIGSTEPYSLSAAQWGYISEARGLRPISFCNKNSHVEEWLGLKNGAGSWGPAVSETQYAALAASGDDNGDGLIDHPSYPAIANSYSNPPVVHRMYFNNDLDDGQCGTFPGNWGWLNFDGGSAANPDRNDWTENGYNDGTVTIREDGEPACPAEPGNGDADDAEEGCVPADSGAVATVNSDALDAILDKKVHIMLFDDGNCVGGAGGGVTCNFEAWGIMGVVLRGYRATGPESDRYLDFEFTDIMLSGTCCVSAPVNGADTGARGVKLCEVDHDFQAGSTIASRCVPTA
jgi:hypothetical protein